MLNHQTKQTFVTTVPEKLLDRRYLALPLIRPQERQNKFGRRQLLPLDFAIVHHSQSIYYWELSTNSRYAIAHYAQWRSLQVGVVDPIVLGALGN